MRATILLGAAAALLVPAVSGAQQPTRRRQQAIEIRGQVPTPQVVTVRPREVPAYSRQVISPNFYDRNFWPSILPGYQLVPERMISGEVPMDSSLVHDSATTPGSGTAGAAGAPRPMTVRTTTPNAATPNLRTAPTTPSSGARPADSTRTSRPDSTRAVPPDSAPPPGTAPAPARP
jgi:hypothetical protein